MKLFFRNYGVFTQRETKSDTETERKWLVYGSVHTDRDPLTIEFHGFGINL